MTDVFKKIKNAELRVQWTGSWNPYFTTTNDGFPGIEVPLDLAGLVQRLKDTVIKVDTDYYNASVESEMRRVLESVIGTEGPGNKRWVPMAASWTTSSHIIWMGNAADSIAFQIGEQSLTADGKVDDTAAKNVYDDTYTFSSSKTGKATYWICFSFQ